MARIVAVMALAALAPHAHGSESFCADKLQQSLVAAPAEWPGNMDCRGYFNCWHGNEEMLLCPKGTVFDPASRQCRWPSELDWQCGPDVTTKEPPATTTQQDADTTTTQEDATTTTQEEPSTTAGEGASCVPRSVLICVNDYSSYWPKCDPSQSKTNTGPDGYEFGYYCSEEWVAQLSAMLADANVDKCNDYSAIRELLAEVAYETGYYSTVYQPRDGGAGLIHMIPQNWPYNAADMDSFWPGHGYTDLVDSLGASFFQTAAYGWRSVAAWYLKTNEVISGCGLNLFDQDYETQTRCILGSVNDRSEAHNVVGTCMEQAGMSP